MRHARIAWLSILLNVAIATPALADPPALLPVQGYLAASEDSTTPPPGTPLDGVYTVRFRLYDDPVSGMTLHDETLDVTVVKGYFTVYLGDDTNGGTALDLSLFRTHGDIYLGLKVGADSEATPRLQLAPTAFAAQSTYCSEASTLGGKVAGDFAAAGHTHAYSSLTGIPSTFTPAAHTHSYTTLTDVPSTFTPAAHTHAYSSLTGIPSTFTPAAHTHSAADVTSGTLDNARFSAYSDLTAEGYLDNNNANDLLTRGQSDARYFALAGGNGTGTIRAPSFEHTTLQTRYLSVPAATFVPYNAATMQLIYLSNYLYTTSSSLVEVYAPVQLPQGAVVTGFTCYWFYNTSAYTLAQRYCGLRRLTMSSTSVSTMSSVSTNNPASSASLVAESASSFSLETVDNQLYGYQVQAWMYTNSGNLSSAARFHGAQITYTTTRLD